MSGKTVGWCQDATMYNEFWWPPKLSFDSSLMRQNWTSEANRFYEVSLRLCDSGFRKCCFILSQCEVGLKSVSVAWTKSWNIAFLWHISWSWHELWGWTVQWTPICDTLAGIVTLYVLRFNTLSSTAQSCINLIRSSLYLFIRNVFTICGMPISWAGYFDICRATNKI